MFEELYTLSLLVTYFFLQFTYTNPKKHTIAIKQVKVC